MTPKMQNLLALVMVVSLLAACRSIQNYQNPAEPLFIGTYAQTPPDFDGELKVITWNIRFAEAIDQAITELDETEELQDADIILLQEMDDVGVETIARTLHYNYVYFPASVHTHNQKNFGNAILSIWPLADPVKLLLPYRNPKNNQRRIAVRALVTVGTMEIPVYSVHTETAWLSSQKREVQIETLLRDIGQDQPRVIVGGDFNTFTAGSIIELEQQFAEFELEPVSRGAGYTFEYHNFGFTLDHIFARGLSADASGVWPETSASDHYPLWVILSLTK